MTIDEYIDDIRLQRRVGAEELLTFNEVLSDDSIHNGVRTEEALTPDGIVEDETVQQRDTQSEQVGECGGNEPEGSVKEVEVFNLCCRQGSVSVDLECDEQKGARNRKSVKDREVVDLCRQQESSTECSQRACPAKYCEQHKQGADTISTQRACPAKYCKQNVTPDERVTLNQTRDGVSDRIGGGGGTQPIFGGLPAYSSLDVKNQGELVDDDSGMKGIDDRELEMADGGCAKVNGTGSRSYLMKR